MSLMGTLAKVAIGVVVAKGIGGMMKPSGGTSTTRSRPSGGMFGNARSRSGGGDLGDVMGDILSGGRGSSAGRSAPTGGGGGLGDLLEELTGAKTAGRTGGAVTRGRQGGGLDDILSQATRGRTASGGGSGGFGLDDILGGLLGGAVGGALGGAMTRGGGAAEAPETGRVMPDREADFGEVLNQAFGRKGEPDIAPTPEQDAAAGLMLRAMIQAVKADGELDEGEKQKLMGNLGDAGPLEMEFVKQELAKPLDVDALIRQVPQGLGPQIYTMSVMAIDLDNQPEAQYLHKLATGLGIGREDVNGIHEKLGVPALYG